MGMGVVGRADLTRQELVRLVSRPWSYQMLLALAPEPLWIEQCDTWCLREMRAVQDVQAFTGALHDRNRSCTIYL